MGGVCWSQASLHQNVNRLTNQLPIGNHYIMHQSHSIRFSDVTVNRNNSNSNSTNNNQYKFVMKISNSSEIQDTISVNLLILNQNIQKLLTENYQLKIYRKMIIDIFNKKLSTTLIQAKNQKSGATFSIQLYSFRGYTSQIFKKSLFNLYILKKKIPQIDNHQIYYHKIIDCFVYGCNPDKQALTILFQKVQTSLANIAQYRKQASWPWTTQQKVKIFIDIMNGVYYLHKKNLYHRDIRPSNIFYVQRLNRYVIGSFNNCIQLQQQYVNQQHNRTVYGIQYMFKKGCDKPQVKKIGNYIQQGKQYAPYSPKLLDYHGLNSILHILQTMDILNLQINFKDKMMLSVYNQFNKIYDLSFDQIRPKILKIGKKYDIQHLKLYQDNQIAILTHHLISDTHRSLIQQFTFQIYDTLGYQKQFSNTTHQLIQKNNQKNKSLENAYLLKNLGQFFERNGAKGTQYYCNACLLFLKRTQKQLILGNLQGAKQDYYQAQKCYIKFSQNFQSHSTYIQIHRIKALIKMNEKQFKKSLEIIKQTFEYAAKKKISIQKQMTLLIAYAKIHLKGNKIQRQIGEQKLKNGLAICENKGAFQNISSCNIHSSNFLYELGILYHSKLRMFRLQQLTKKYEIRAESFVSQIMDRQLQASQYPRLKALTESSLKSSLQLRQKQNIDVIQIINVLQQLGSFYYDIQLYVEAKKTFQRCQILMKDASRDIYPIIIIKCLYSFGSTLYSLKQYSDAQRKYQKALALFDKLNDESFDLMKYNIEGNLGLVQMQMNKGDGQKRIIEAKNQIKRIKSQNFYDYVFLRQKLIQIKNRKKKRA